MDFSFKTSTATGLEDQTQRGEGGQDEIRVGGGVGYGANDELLCISALTNELPGRGWQSLSEG